MRVNLSKRFINLCEDIKNKLEISEMAKIPPKRSNLLVSLFMSPETTNKHIPRLKVSNTKGLTFNKKDNFSIAISDDPIILAGTCKLSNKELLDVETWVVLNKKLLIQYWFGDDEDTVDLLLKLKPIGIK